MCHHQRDPDQTTCVEAVMATESNTTIISRKEAIRIGLPRYFTGKACKNGHIAERGTSRGTCFSCHKEWRGNNPGKLRAWKAAYRAANPDLHIKEAKSREARRPGIDAARAKARRDADPERERQIRRRSYTRRKDCPKFRLDAAMRAGICASIKKGDKRGRRSYDLLGYRRRELMAHLEALFSPGMSWENYGEWHIDHVVPLAAFNFTTCDCFDFKRAWRLSNLQPLWAHENMKKSAKISTPFQPSLL